MTDEQTAQEIKSKLTDFMRFADDGKFSEESVGKSIDKFIHDLLNINATDSDDIKKVKNDVTIQLNKVKDTFTSDVSNETLGNSFFDIKKAIPSFEDELYFSEPSPENERITQPHIPTVDEVDIEKAIPSFENASELTSRQVGEKLTNEENVIDKRGTFIEPVQTDSVDAFNNGGIFDLIADIEREELNKPNLDVSGIENFANGISIPEIEKVSNNHLASVEMATEDNMNMIDGIPNNTTPRADVEIQEELQDDLKKNVDLKDLSNMLEDKQVGIMSLDNLIQSVQTYTLAKNFDADTMNNINIMQQAVNLDEQLGNVIDQLVTLKEQLPEINNDMSDIVSDLNNTKKTTTAMKTSVENAIDKSIEKAKGNENRFFKEVGGFSKLKLKSCLGVINDKLTKDMEHIDKVIEKRSIASVKRQVVHQDIKNIYNALAGKEERYRKIPEANQKIIKSLNKQKDVLNEIILINNKFINKDVSKVEEKENSNPVVEEKQFLSVFAELEKKQEIIKENKPKEIVNEQGFDEKVNVLATTITKYLQGTPDTVNVEDIKENLAIGETDKVKDVLLQATNDKDNLLIKKIDDLVENHYPKNIVIKTKNTNDECKFKKDDNITTMTILDKDSKVKNCVAVESSGNIFKDIEKLTGKKMKDIVTSEKNVISTEKKIPKDPPKDPPTLPKNRKGIDL